MGDSITRNICFFTATTHCFPGATVQHVLDKLLGLLRSLPSFINRGVVHVGSNDTGCQHSELTKKDFNDHFSLLKECEKSVFISGPLTTLSQGVGRFSRMLGLNTWLQSACRAHNVGFIDNFSPFWNRSKLYWCDGLYPSRQGSHMLAANVQHMVQCSPCD
uniref:SGNH hydrolase-type esterase domain-containing protein n=1 Tax=Amphiprion percula TaxID=161767 RepID=A0A3P8SLH8_AMPPE